MKVEEITSSEDRITEVALREGRVSLVPEGSVLLVTRSGILAHTLPVAVTKLPVTINQDLKALAPRPDVLPKYVAHAVRGASRRILKECSKHGTTVASIETNALLDFEIPLVNLDEQRRIVAEIEKQFSRLDKAIANLQRVKASLKRYKASVLKAAVEGRLVPTEAQLARRGGRGYETGMQLLHRILEARRTTSQPGGRYNNPVAPNVSDLPTLPEGWTWATAEQLTDASRSITYGVIKLGENVKSGIPVLRSSDVRWLRIDLHDVKTISHDIANSYRRTFLRGGEVLLTVRGTLGGVAVVPTKCQGYNISREVAMLAPVDPETSEILALFIASAPLQHWLLQRAKGIAYTGINIETLKSLPIPLPPLAEQDRISSAAARHLSFAAEAERTLELSLAKCNALRHAILEASLRTRSCSTRAG